VQHRGPNLCSSCTKEDLAEATNRCPSAVKRLSASPFPVLKDLLELPGTRPNTPTFDQRKACLAPVTHPRSPTIAFSLGQEYEFIGDTASMFDLFDHARFLELPARRRRIARAPDDSRSAAACDRFANLSPRQAARNHVSQQNNQRFTTHYGWCRTPDPERLGASKRYPHKTAARLQNSRIRFGHLHIRFLLMFRFPRGNVWMAVNAHYRPSPQALFRNNARTAHHPVSAR
jgi:hypothetical protein